MAKHRRATRRPPAATILSDEDRTRISRDLMQTRPLTPQESVEAAIHDAVHTLAGLDTANHHVITLVRTRAEAILACFPPTGQQTP
jgi:hypothetical protein